MSKGGGQTTASQSVDPQTRAYIDYMRRVAMGYVGGADAGTGAPQGGGGFLGSHYGAGAPRGPIVQALPPEIQQAMDQYRQYATAGNLGLSALTGQGDAQQSFMNPYLQTLNPYFDQLRSQAVNAANEQATLAGAYGGGRGDVAQGVALGQVANTQAQLGYSAFNDAMQRALSAANLGFGAQAQSAFLPQQYASGQLGLLGQALGPYGQTTTQPLYRNRLAGAFGGAAAGAPFGPIGAGIGGLLGYFG